MPRTATGPAPATPPVLAKKPTHQQQQHDQQPAPSAPLLPAPHQEPAICRLCWGEASEDDESDPLLSPCRCAGSLQYIHAHCLADWQRTLRAQGQGRRAHICELCKTPYRLQQDSQQQGGVATGPRRHLHRRLLAAASDSLFDTVYRTPWPSLAVQLWHSYVMTHGAVQVSIESNRPAQANGMGPAC